MKSKLCKHCGRSLQDHVHLPSPEEADKKLEGYPLSLLECLQADGFETSSAKDSSSSENG